MVKFYKFVEKNGKNKVLVTITPNTGYADLWQNSTKKAPWERRGEGLLELAEQMIRTCLGIDEVDSMVRLYAKPFAEEILETLENDEEWTIYGSSVLRWMEENARMPGSQS